MHGPLWAPTPLTTALPIVQARRPARQGSGEPPYSERCARGLWQGLHFELRGLNLHVEQAITRQRAQFSPSGLPSSC